MVNELKPCPFCGSRNIEISNTHTPAFTVRCEDCEAEASGQYFEGPIRDTRFSYSPTPVGEYEADYTGLHPEYRRAFKSAITAWNTRADTGRLSELEAEVVRLRSALKPFKLIADMEERAEPGASVIVNVDRCRDARAALAAQS